MEQMLRIDLLKATVLFFVLSLGFTMKSQVHSDKVRTIPTEEGDPDSEFLLHTHLENSQASNSAQLILSDTVISNLKSESFLEYRIGALSDGAFTVHLYLGAERADALVNVGVYKENTEAWPSNGIGDTALVATLLNTNRKEWYVFKVSLEANEIYKLRVNFMNANTRNTMCSLYGIKILEGGRSSDSNNLSDLRINGNTISEFDPQRSSYSLRLDSAQWVDSVGATAVDSKATVEITEQVIKEGVNSTYLVNTRSAQGDVKDYRINIESEVKQVVQNEKLRIIPTIEGDESSQFLLASHATDWVMTHSNFDQNQHFTNQELSLTQANNYVEYQIIAPFGGTFAAALNLASDDEDAEVNVSVYKTEQETWSESGMTHNVYNESWREGRDTWFILELEEATVYTLRISFLNAPSNLFGLKIYEMTGNYKDNLAELKVNGIAVPDFEPEKDRYNIAIPVGATSVNVFATTEAPGFSEVLGMGDIPITGPVTSDTLVVQLIFGHRKAYILNFIAPIEVKDGLELALSEELFKSEGATVTDSVITDFKQNDYVSYYIYSLSDKDLKLRVNAVNGNRDNIYSELSLQNYVYGSDWLYQESNMQSIPRLERDNWSRTLSSDIEFQLSLKANEPLVMRLNGVTNAPETLANIYSLSFVENNVNALNSNQNSAIKAWGSNGMLTLHCDALYLGADVRIFDISGRLVQTQQLNSTQTDYKLDKAGMYIIKISSSHKLVSPIKCWVR